MQRISRYLILVFAGAVLLGFAGCSGQKGPKKVSVSGEVTLDGNPIPDGEVIFRPTDGEGTPAAGKIKDGKYTLECTPGPKKVTVTAMRSVAGAKGGKLETGEEAVNVEQYIPKKYNDKTELTADVGDSNQSGVDFPLTTK